MARVRRNWTPEEDALLRSVVNNAMAQSRPLLWRELAKSIPGRSNKDCRRRWWNTLADCTAKGSWSAEEDARLIEAVRQYGPNWGQVARAVKSRNSDQCSSHWSQVLDPSINHCDWTEKEDSDLLHAVLTHGTNWTTIAASHTPRRTTLALKNRYSTLRLRHENGGKSKDRSVSRAFSVMSSSSEGTAATTQRDTKTPQRTDDDEYDEDKEYEDSVDERTEDANATIIGSHINGLGMSTLNSWANPGLLTPPTSMHNGTSCISTPSWSGETIDTLHYANQYPLDSHSSPYLGLGGEEFFGVGHDLAGMGTCAPYAVYGGDSMHLNYSRSPSCSPPSQTSSSTPSISGHLMDPETAPSTPPSCMTTPSFTPPAQFDDFNTCSVTINANCTTLQLEAIMKSLSGIKSNVKIDPSSL
ncbi:uncharacterized protein F4822DRAFT_208311 [Hypoxylon trugodes]|uniref:uncharacterized protein n=1 Tax=Hypoxylon trugodes TaxID=326681 RepID=UPI00218CBFAD|nr:uncharacterized protein F4822DRAFT_208311 [Hypoxylon trugodes]KAI1389676.1 hypothetical protein F4822DRAFT_208311 [Hypoxylon trugodes]